LTEHLLRKSFSSDQKVIKGGIDPLFCGLGPLSTFASRIKLSYALNLIDDNVYKTLNIIRDIRNTCAHEFKMISFTDQFIKDKIAQISFPNEAAIPFAEEEMIKQILQEDKELKEIEDFISSIHYREEDTEKLKIKMKFILAQIYVFSKISLVIKKKI
jgi:DNA-binding MltR family transcriptional regulator